MDNILFMLTSFVQIYEVDILCKSFFSNRNNSKVISVVLYCLSYIMITFPYMIFHIPFVTMVCSLIGVAIVTFVYKSSIKKRILAAVSFVAIMILSECIVAFFAGFITNSLIIPDRNYNILGTVCVPIVQLIVVLVIKNIIKTRENKEYSLYIWIISIMLPVFSIVLFLIFCKNYNNDDIELLISVIVLLLINMSVFILLEQLSKNYALENENRQLALEKYYQNKQFELIQDSVNKVRQDKHEYKKHISMINYLYEKDDRDELKKYLNQLGESILIEDTYADTGNKAFDSIINYRVQKMKEKNIDVHIDVAIMEEIALSIYDLNIIVGNLLDNSMEAAEKTNDKWVKIEIIQKNKKFNIHISNSYMESDITENIRTTKQNKEEHGFGIENIKKTLEKYNYVYDIDKTNGVYTTYISVMCE